MKNQHGIYRLKLLTLAAAVALCAGCARQDAAQDMVTQVRSDLPLIVVARQTVVNEFAIPGVASALPDHSVKITASLAGKIERVFVVPGQRVARGALVAQLDKQALSARLLQATAAVEQERGALKVAQAQQEQAAANIATHDAAVRQAQVAVEQATDNVRRQERLFQAEVSAGKDTNAAKAQLEMAKAQLQSAKAQVAVGAGQMHAAKAQTAVAQAQLESAQAARKQILVDLSFADVRSPISGVVASRYLNVGDSADLNAAIALIVDLSQVMITAEAPSDDLHQITAGDTASIFDLAGKLIQEGSVVEVSPVVDAKNNSVPILIKADNSNGRLRQGQAVKVSVQTKIDRSALVVPRSALVPDPDQPGQFMVYVVRDGKAVRTKVLLGSQTATDAEVTSGLQGGEQIVAAGAYGLPDGTPVKGKS